MSDSRILDAMHETAVGLYSAGVMDQVTMRNIESLCIPPVKKLTANQIKRLRLENRVSQAIFAKYLNVKPITVKKWELGEKTPGGSAAKLLQVVQHGGLGVLAYQNQ